LLYILNSIKFLTSISLILLYNSYSDALSAAKQAKVEGNLSNVGISPFGGSSHGVIEFIYRIHASRLKVMLTAVRLSENIRENAEQEALRISEKYWFEEENKMSSENITICTRKRVWLVLEDVVAAMNYCRRMQPFFHRSVYRHAQAVSEIIIFNVLHLDFNINLNFFC